MLIYSGPQLHPLLAPFPFVGLCQQNLSPSVGPFVLLDHFGPVPAPPEKLPAHPHAGIEVMTYLIDGANEHTDSLGNIGQIGAGGAQWMKAGRGILHTERNLLDRATVMNGLQIWARLPIAEQDDAPDYCAYQSEDMIEWDEGGTRFRLIAGFMGDRLGPLPLAIPSLMVHIFVADGSKATIDLPDATHEYAAYVIAADEPITVNGTETVTQGTIMRFASGTEALELETAVGTPAEVFLLGGEPAPKPLIFGGPFVLDSERALALAKRRFQTGEMGTLDGVPF